MYMYMYMHMYMQMYMYMYTYRYVYMFTYIYIHIYIHIYIYIHLHTHTHTQIRCIASCRIEFFPAAKIILPEWQEPAAPVPEAPKPNCWANVLPRSDDTTHLHMERISLTWEVSHSKNHSFMGFIWNLTNQKQSHQPIFISP